MASSLVSDNQSSLLSSFAPSPVPLIASGLCSLTFFKSLKTNTKIRAHILPKQIRPSYIFAPETLTWLKSCAISISGGGNATYSYVVPLLGITNRPLPDYKKAGFNLFRTLVKVTTRANLNNFDQCTIEFGQRLPINAQDFAEEMYRQIYATSTRIKTKGRLTFYCSNLGSTAITTDLETLRLAIIKAQPTINIDWLDARLGWDTCWNPCANLEPIQAKLEDKLIKFLDSLIQRVCASQCNALIQRPNCFFDNVYMPHRRKQQLPALNKAVFMPNSDMQNNRILDLFKAEKDLLSQIGQKINSKFPLKANSSTIQADEKSGWLPAIL